MVGRVPVLREDDVFAFLDQPVDGRNDFIAAINRQRTAGAEIILDVDNHKCMTDHETLPLGLLCNQI